MALYTDRDIRVTLSGDLALDTKGDLDLAQCHDSHVAAANFLLKMNIGEYKPKISMGANLGLMIGEPLTEENLDFAEDMALRELVENVYTHEDVTLSIFPLDQHEVICVVEALGTYLVSGEFVNPEPQVFSYSFPYMEGDPTNQITEL